MRHLKPYTKLFEGRDFIPNSENIKDIDDILLDLIDDDFGVRRDISSNNKIITISIYKLVNGVQNAFNIDRVKDTALRLYNYANAEGYKFEMYKDNKFGSEFTFKDFPPKRSSMEMIWHFTMKIINKS